MVKFTHSSINLNQDFVLPSQASKVLDMDIVDCGNVGFENWNEVFLDCSSTWEFTDLSTEKNLGDTLGLELTCKPSNSEQRPVNLLEQNIISGDFASREEIFPWASGNECLILPAKSINTSSANGKKRKKVFNDRSRLSVSNKDQRTKNKGEGSDDKQISGKSLVSNTCCKHKGEGSDDKQIHLRNNHSQAERIRREKISERMKFLQDIVPGYSKIIGKAAMLDEIINYVLSLQQQIVFLSRKVTTVCPDENLDKQKISPGHAYCNMIHHFQDGSTSIFGGPKIKPFCSVPFKTNPHKVPC